jgi:hypothetical protein
MKRKILSVLLFAIIVPLVMRHRVAVYMAEETFVVLSVVAISIIALLFIHIVFTLLREGLRLGFRWLADKTRGSGEFARPPLKHAKASRSQSLGHGLSKHGVAGSRIHAPEDAPGTFRWLR